MPSLLMIDDDASMLALVETFLKTQGWRFRGAPRAAKGLEMLRSEKPDVILLDVNLPDMDGFAVCSKIKSNPETAHLPLVLISGERKKAEDVLKGLTGVQADAYLVKPVNVLLLKAKLEAVMRPGAPGAEAV